MYIDLIFSGYNGFILIRNIVSILFIILIILNILYYIKGNRIVGYLIIIIAPLCSFVINLWLINHFRNLMHEFYTLAIVFRENDNEKIINGIILNDKLLQQEFIFSLISLFILFISFLIIKKKSFIKRETVNTNLA
jgi:hypothetical protein